MFQPIYKPFQIRRALDLYNKVKSFRVASKKSGTSKSTIHRWWNSFQLVLYSRGRYQKKKRRTRRPKYLDLSSQLKKLFETPLFIYYSLKSIQSALRDRRYHRLTPSKSWIHALLRKNRISRRRFVPTQLVSINKERFNNQVDDFTSILMYIYIFNTF